MLQVKNILPFIEKTNEQISDADDSDSDIDYDFDYDSGDGIGEINPYDVNTNKYVFDFAEEGTVGRAIFEDNIELLQQLLAVHPDEGKGQMFDINYVFPVNDHFDRNKANRIEVAALFGSIKCFKYLLMNERSAKIYLPKVFT